MSASRMPAPAELSALARILWQRLEPGTDDMVLMVQISQLLPMLAQELDFAVARQERCAGINAEGWRAMWVQTAKQDEEKRQRISQLEAKLKVFESAKQSGDTGGTEP